MGDLTPSSFVDVTSPEVRQALSLHFVSASAFGMTMAHLALTLPHIYAVVPDGFVFVETAQLAQPLRASWSGFVPAHRVAQLTVGLLHERTFDAVLSQWERYEPTVHTLASVEARAVQVCQDRSAALLTHRPSVERLTHLLEFDFNWFGSAMVVLGRLEPGTSGISCEHLHRTCRLVVLPAFDLDSFLVLSSLPI